MSKYELKGEAQKLRREGYPINEIKKKLGLSKSTVSLWCRDIILTEEQYKKIKKEHIFKTQKGRLIGAQMNKNKRINAIKDANILGRKLIRKISKRELLLIAIALYWSEGSKSDRTSGFIFINSDPEMILVMKLFLINVLHIPLEEIVCSIQINRIHEERIDKVLNFWKKLLQLQNSQFRKPYYVNTKVNKVYDNYENYYGICRLAVRKGMNLKYRMLGLIKAIKEDILPV
ncbi:hypothetical protein COX93_02555 [Candidatus Nomurabacteria bacterium CG_4_10_14_0_2_um_filter_30_12]|uniref:Resolvase HTH domain-containing protein n=3 Tax=Candidatus Nomuraibacteriota TaxID=1752729 RepID=A0A1J4V5Q7_9BACT|nr:MAG: hypothetical protein AUJ22_00540 [Candidatus Nomurabacteria bacterium CG1_02_31_12]PIR69004.1 MAG: hypothetical protein COU48_00920 [Candidatus Nomurabacteria bacterium CG10_big_fil_rev_8_21_14_0_10_03_31_7]PIZ86998.1 MAG: hypothetical protein COX93_02555 [Candidatus Nomurabacteria bacterium CG_4_10_14_0_2_um_filter_30_12]